MHGMLGHLDSANQSSQRAQRQQTIAPCLPDLSTSHPAILAPPPTPPHTPHPPWRQLVGAEDVWGCRGDGGQRGHKCYGRAVESRGVCRRAWGDDGKGGRAGRKQNGGERLACLSWRTQPLVLDGHSCVGSFRHPTRCRDLSLSAQHGAARHGTARHGTARHGTARHTTARRSTCTRAAAPRTYQGVADQALGAKVAIFPEQRLCGGELQRGGTDRQGVGCGACRKAPTAPAAQAGAPPLRPPTHPPTHPRPPVP